MLLDSWGSDVDYATAMGRPEVDVDLSERVYQHEMDEAEHDWWTATEPPAADLLEILQKVS